MIMNFKSSRQDIQFRGRILCSEGLRGIVTYATTGRCEATLESHIHSVHPVTFSPDIQRLASASVDSDIKDLAPPEFACLLPPGDQRATPTGFWARMLVIPILYSQLLECNSTVTQRRNRMDPYFISWANTFSDPLTSSGDPFPRIGTTVSIIFPICSDLFRFGHSSWTTRAYPVAFGGAFLIS
ncbi:hypothetical protein EDB81DRAFT_243702 [Dactylonectria macrodidyma]|uniref:Uncharacterized protein n=1 Tax=Dactylonectria macrodidyma TaxID=307937 RepID=A0A9P9DE04_9HYPO|nr:hypothetical protein EDB81DRAFT_243702 [Dactylonectria macrodidyma]